MLLGYRPRLWALDEHMKISQARGFCSISRFPAGAAGHEAIDPEVDLTVLDRWPQIASYERQNLTSPSAGSSGSSAWA
jgi:hypothetical protein